MLSTMGGMWACSLVLQEKGNRFKVKLGSYAFWFAAFIDFIIMCLYVDQLKDPESGQTWATGLALIIVNWLIVLPLTAFVLRLVLATNKYADPNRRKRTNQVTVSPSSASMGTSLPAGMASQHSRRELVAFDNAIVADSPKVPNVDTSKKEWVDSDGRAIRAV